jgi:hypothetical protein
VDREHLDFKGDGYGHSTGLSISLVCVCRERLDFGVEYCAWRHRLGFETGNASIKAFELVFAGVTSHTYRDRRLDACASCMFLLDLRYLHTLSS